MLEILEILSQYLIMTFGGFFTSFIISKIIREVETENMITAAIAAVVLSGVISGIVFLVFVPNLIFLQVVFLSIAFCLFLGFISEKGSWIKTIMAIVASLAIYFFISWIYLPFPIGVAFALAFFLCGSLASFEEENKIIFPILAFLLTVTAPFLTKPTIFSIWGKDIPVMLIVYIVLFAILIGAALKGEVGIPGKISMGILLIIMILFFLFPTFVPGISPETLWYGEVAAREFARQTQLYRRYLEIYRRLQQNETLRKLYSTGEYELPEEQSFLLEPNRGLIISYKEEDILKLWEGDRITVEIMGRVENPLENPVQVLILPEIPRVEGVGANDYYCDKSNFKWTVSCSFMKQELPESKENKLLQNILNSWTKGEGDIEVLYKKSFEPFECKINITNADSYDSNCNLNSNVKEIYFDLKIYILYDMYTSSIIELDLMGKEKYTSLLRFEKLKEKDLVSYSTWGPLKGVMRVFGYEKNPIPVEEVGKTLSIYLYTISYVPSGNASMRCYIFAVPKIGGINITSVPGGCENATEINVSEKCGIDISKTESLYYGFPIYDGYFDEISEDYHIYVCEDENWKDFKYKGDPIRSEEIKVFKIKALIDPREEMLVFPQAHYIYVFRDLKEIPVVVKR